MGITTSSRAALAPGRRQAHDVGPFERQAKTFLRRRRVAPGASAFDADLKAFEPLWEVPASRTHLDPLPGVRMAARRDAAFRRCLAAADILAVLLALLVATHFRSGVQLSPADLLLVPFVLVIGKSLGLYDRDQHRVRKGTLDEVPLLLQLAGATTLVAWLAEALLFVGALNRAQVFMMFAAVFVSSVLLRALARGSILRSTPAERILIIGNERSCARAVEAFRASRASATHATIVGDVRLPDNVGPRTHLQDLPVTREAVTWAIAHEEIERVIFVPDGCDQEQALDLIRLIKAVGVKLSVLPRMFEVIGSSSAFDEIDGITLLGVRSYGISRSSEWLKRALDVTASAVALVVLLPLLGALALLIKLDSPGPVFFVQQRIGRQGRRFGMIKFRSMVHDAEALKSGLHDRNEAVGGMFKIRDDPRITRLGRLLRSTSLDELPQLVNVLRGDMSLVGPRPLVAGEDELIEDWRRRRLAVRPGMTGMWQIFGSTRIPLQEMVKIDYMYGANWSLWLDLKILLRTVPYVLQRRGA